MKKLTFSILLICICSFAKAQYVTIPDTTFASYLNAFIPLAMNGNQMDTTSIYVTSFSDIDVSSSSIYDLYGVQYFTNLQTLLCSDNNLTSLPNLPTNLNELDCSSNQ